MFNSPDVSNQLIDLVMELLDTLAIEIVNLSLLRLQLSHLTLECFNKMLIKLFLRTPVDKLSLLNNLNPSPSLSQFANVLVPK
jgi:hypothetical protein